MRLMPRLPAGWPYLVSIALTKGLSIITIPVVARFVSPDDFGRLDVVASVVEFLGLICAMGLADTLFRFAGTAKTPHDRNRIAAEIAGTALLLAAIMIVTLQIAAPAILSLLPVPFDETAVRASFVAAALSGAIALPLGWLRLSGNALHFLLFTSARGLLQALLSVCVLYLGYGVEEVLITNALVDVIIAIGLIGVQWRTSGISISRDAFRHSVFFGFPLVGSGLAMFGLGACSRWFLAANIETSELAQYALAAKLAMATPLLLQPFTLWWYACRLSVLEKAGGLGVSASATGTGFSILVLSAAAVCLAGPVFIEYVLPASYHGAIAYLPWIVGIAVLNEMCSLLNVGCYRSRHGFQILAINSSGAIVAVAGYALTAADYGVAGIIGATIAGHFTRIFFFLFFGHAKAPIPYPLMRGGLLLAAALGALWFVPETEEMTMRIGWSMVSMSVLLALSAGMGFMNRKSLLLAQPDMMK